MKKHRGYFIFGMFLIVVASLLVLPVVYGAWVEPASGAWHNAEDVKIDIGGEYTLNSWIAMRRNAISSGGITGTLIGGIENCKVKAGTPKTAVCDVWPSDSGITYAVEGFTGKYAFSSGGDNYDSVNITCPSGCNVVSGGVTCSEKTKQLQNEKIGEDSWKVECSWGFSELERASITCQCGGSSGTSDDNTLLEAWGEDSAHDSWHTAEEIKVDISEGAFSLQNYIQEDFTTTWEDETHSVWHTADEIKVGDKSLDEVLDELGEEPLGGTFPYSITIPSADKGYELTCPETETTKFGQSEEPERYAEYEIGLPTELLKTGERYEFDCMYGDEDVGIKDIRFGPEGSYQTLYEFTERRPFDLYSHPNNEHFNRYSGDDKFEIKIALKEGNLNVRVFREGDECTKSNNIGTCSFNENACPIYGIRIDQRGRTYYGWEDMSCTIREN